MEKLRRLRSGPAHGQLRVVPHRPGLRVVTGLLVAVVVAGAAALGYWLGIATRELDADYLAALETRERALEARIDSLSRELADARLGRSVDAQAAQSLRETISDLRERVAGLREEVTFYKSLMAPSSIERGLQIAEFDLAATGVDDQFSYHILLTQAEEQRSWVQGSVRLDVHGVRPAGDGSTAEEVVSLADLEDAESYPLRFRFRYFQDFAGTLTLPGGFRPRTVVITAIPSGNGERIERQFDWIVQPG